jgi:hypothetical protein
MRAEAALLVLDVLERVKCGAILDRLTRIDAGGSGKRLDARVHCNNLNRN